MTVLELDISGLVEDAKAQRSPMNPRPLAPWLDVLRAEAAPAGAASAATEAQKPSSEAFVFEARTAPAAPSGSQDTLPRSPRRRPSAGRLFPGLTWRAEPVG